MPSSELVDIVAEHGVEVILFPPWVFGVVSVVLYRRGVQKRSSKHSDDVAHEVVFDWLPCNRLSAFIGMTEES